MITGIHALLYARDAHATRAFLKDVLGWPHVDAGGGWLIFALPPAEVAAHPDERGGRHELYLMCDDIHVTVTELRAKGVQINGDIQDQGWGFVSAIMVPGLGPMALYQPKHPIALALS